MPGKNLEIILKKAAVDADFREKLLQNRSNALAEHEIELDADEKAMLDSVPESQLQQMISVTPVSRREKSLLTTSILSVGVVTAVAFGIIGAGSVVTTLGIRPSAADGDHSTKMQMSNLKSALLCYLMDVGRLPISGGPPYSDEAIAEANEKYFGSTFATNVLVNPNIDSSVFFRAEEVDVKSKSKWRGPYMDKPPEEFMVGANGGLFRLARHENRIYLHHPGPDLVYEQISFVVSSEFDRDDHAMILTTLHK